MNALFTHCKGNPIMLGLSLFLVGSLILYANPAQGQSCTIPTPDTDYTMTFQGVDYDGCNSTWTYCLEDADLSAVQTVFFGNYGDCPTCMEEEALVDAGYLSPSGNLISSPNAIGTGLNDSGFCGFSFVPGTYNCFYFTLTGIYAVGEIEVGVETTFTFGAASLVGPNCQEQSASICDDGCPLTIDEFNENDCACSHTWVSPDDGCDLTTDYIDYLNCQIINEPPNIDDGCPETTDFFNASSCSIVHLAPDCSDDCSATLDYFDSSICSCVNEVQDLDDGCDLTFDYYDEGTCNIVHEGPNCDDGCDLTYDYFNADICNCGHILIEEISDGCSLTTDYYDAENCVIVHELNLPEPPCPDFTTNYNEDNCTVSYQAPNCNDFCQETTDYYDYESCQCVNETPSCDDGCPLTNDYYDDNICGCVNEEPNVDDGCYLTTDYFDAEACQVVNAPPPCPTTCELVTHEFNYDNCTLIINIPDCDDGCPLTEDSFNQVSCDCVYQLPDVDDGCDLTDDYFDSETCAIINEPNIPQSTVCDEITAEFDAENCDLIYNYPSCNDGCDLTNDYYDTDICDCVYELPDPNDFCDLTIDYFDENTCEIVNQIPDVDDGCPNTTDYFDATNCEIINIGPFCGDDCPNTIDYFDTETCSCVNEIPNVDDGCDLTVDYFDENTCEIVNQEPDCDDSCNLTLDLFDPETCSCNNVEAAPNLCDDGNDCTLDFFDEEQCECSYEPIAGCGTYCTEILGFWGNRNEEITTLLADCPFEDYCDGLGNLVVGEYTFTPECIDLILPGQPNANPNSNVCGYIVPANNALMQELVTLKLNVVYGWSGGFPNANDLSQLVLADVCWYNQSDFATIEELPDSIATVGDLISAAEDSEDFELSYAIKAVNDRFEGCAPAYCEDEIAAPRVPNVFLIDRYGPNPTYDKVYINVTANEIDYVDLMVTGVDGRILRSGQYEIVRGKNQIMVELGDLPSNSYFISLKSGSFMKTIRVVLISD